MPKAQNTKDIKFRAPEEWMKRLQWVMYCEGMTTQQDAMVAALDLWLNSMESKWGPPIKPKAQEEHKVKRFGRS